MSIKLDIVSLFSSDYSASFSGREVARRMNVSPQTAIDGLKELEKEKVLMVKIEGRNDKYALNKENLKTKVMMQLMETHQSMLALEKFILKEVVSKILPYSKTIIVFGSFARNEEKKDSDIDLIVIDSKDKEKIKKIKEMFPLEVNIEFVSLADFSKAFEKKNSLALEIKKDHLIYGDVYNIVNLYCR